MRYLTVPKKHEESSAEILAMLVTLSLSVNEVRRNVDSLSVEMKGSVKKLEDQMKKVTKISRKNQPQNGSKVQEQRHCKTASPK